MAPPEALFAEVEAWLAAEPPAGLAAMQRTLCEAEQLTARLRERRQRILERLLELERAERWARAIPSGGETGAIAIDTRA